MTAPRQLGVVKVEPCAEVVAVLKDALELAEKGDLSQVAIAFVARGGTTGFEYGMDGGVCTSALIGTVARLQNFLIRTADEDDEED
jgi:hypothetical protein